MAEITMRMAKASTEECLAVMRLGQMLEDVMDDERMPRDLEGNSPAGSDYFDEGSFDDLKVLYKHLQQWCSKHDTSAVIRVAMGMGMVVDPANELLDPEVGHLARHPKYVRMAAELEELKALVAAQGQPATVEKD